MRALQFLLLFFISSMLYGSNFKLIYEQNDVTFMELRNVNGDIIHRFSKSDKSYKDVLASYKFQAGSYRLRFCYNKMQSMTDTLEYDFQLKGTEQEVNFTFAIGRIKKIGHVEEWVTNNPEGFITICKYYPIPQGVSIELQQSADEKGNDWPYFKLSNNTQFDLYGGSIFGGFYGSISYLMADSIWGKPIMTAPDFKNTNQEPLHSGQSIIAKIGDYLPGHFHWQDGLYRYNIQITDRKTNRGVFSPTILNGDYKVYTQDESLYNLNYDFRWQRNK